MQQVQQIASILIQALPYIRRYRKKNMVIKYGGNAMTEPGLQRAFAQDIVLLQLIGIHPIIVHGGGPQIGKLLSALNMESRFIDGVRVTDSNTMDVVEMVLGGQINKHIVSLINAEGGRAVGLTGKDARLIQAQRIDLVKGSQLGQVGQVESIDPQILHTLTAHDCIPVIAPVGYADNGESLNINADTVAGKLAEALQCEKLIILTNTAGVLDESGQTISHLTPDLIQQGITEGVIHGGMLPKVNCALEALASGVKKVHIVDGRLKHATLLELFTDTGVGTLIE